MKPFRQAEVVESVQAVGAAHRRKARGQKSAAQNIRRRFANPLQAGLPAAVIERQHQQDASMAGAKSEAGPVGARIAGYGLSPATRRETYRQTKCERQQSNRPHFLP